MRSRLDGKKEHPEIFEKFGGHKQAAGLTIREGNLDLLRDMLNGPGAPQEELLTEKLLLDMVLPFSYCTQELLEEIKIMEPCGPENRAPLFAAKNISISSVRLLGQEKNVLAFTATDEYGTTIPCVAFSSAVDMIEEIYKKTGVLITKAPAEDLKKLKFTIAFSLNLNEFRGSKTVQAVIRDILL